MDEPSSGRDEEHKHGDFSPNDGEHDAVGMADSARPIGWRAVLYQLSCVLVLLLSYFLSQYDK